MQPWFTVYFFDIGHSCYDQLTPVKTRYLLTSITGPYRGPKSTTYRGHVFLKLTADQAYQALCCRQFYELTSFYGNFYCLQL